MSDTTCVPQLRNTTDAIRSNNYALCAPSYTSSDTYSCRGGEESSSSSFTSKPASLGSLENGKHALHRLGLLRVGWRYAPKLAKGVRGCGRRAINHADWVEYVREGGSIHIANVSYCRSPFCAWCAPKRAADTAERLTKALKVAETKGYQTKFLTFTVPTDNWSTKRQYQVLREAFTSFKKRCRRHLEYQHQSSEQLKVGWAYSFDATFRKNKGYSAHLHIHAIVATSSGDENALNFDYRRYWLECVRKAAGRAVRLYKDACYSLNIHKDVGISGYINKFLGSATEIMNSFGKDNFKASVGMFKLIQEIDKTGNKDAIIAYQDIIEAFYKKHYSSVGQFFGKLERELKEEEENASDEDEEELEFYSLKMSQASHTALTTLNNAIPKLFKLLLSGDVKRINEAQEIEDRINKHYRGCSYTTLYDVRHLWAVGLSQLGI